MAKRLLSALAIPIMSLGALAFTAQPAAAADTFSVCNSSESVDPIIVKLDSGGASAWVYRGQCWNNIPAPGTTVDVDPAGYGGDVDSYKIGVIGSGYGPCHVGETNSSNPPNESAGVRYRTYTNSSCS